MAETVYVDDVVIIKAPLVSNGGFETGDKTGWSCNSGTATIVTDAYSGNYALQLENPSAWGEACVRTIGVKANTQYEVSFKAKRVSGTGAFNLVISSPVSPWTKFTKISGQNWMAASDATDANGWATYSCVYNSDSFTQMLIKFTSEAASAGSIIIDDIEVTELKDPSFDGYLYNGDFETGKTNPWTTYQSTAASEDAANSGEYGMVLGGDGGWGGMAYQDITTVPGEYYYFYGFFKTVSAGTNIQILDQATSTKLTSTWFNKTSWSLVKLSFVAQGTTTRINFCGGGSVYLKKGDSLLVPDYTNYLAPAEVTLNFTYMTAGYIGYYGTTVGGADGTLTMSVFRIQQDGSVIVGRYDENGIHNLKSAGVKNTERGDIMDADPTVYESYRVVTATSDEEYTGE